MVVDATDLVGTGLAIELGGQEFSDIVAIHLFTVAVGPDLVPELRQWRAMDHLTQLLVAAKDGDRRALERFVAETQADVWRVCRYLGDRDDADDLVQETYERAIGSIHRFRGDGSTRGWLLTIARRTCVDHTRRAARRRRLGRQTMHEATSGSMEGTLVTADASGRVDLDELVTALDPDRRAAFVMTQVLGLHYDEAAEVLGCPIGTVRSRVSRARGDLLAAFADPTTNEQRVEDSGTFQRRRST